MIKKIVLKNSQIYSLGSDILTYMNDDIKFPAKSMFYIQKNMNYLLVLAREIDDARTKILERYGKLNEEEDRYSIDEKEFPTLQKELTDLLSLEQEVKMYPIKLDWLGDVELSRSQMRVIELMIEEPEEEPES